MFSSASDLIRVRTRPRSAFLASGGGSEALAEVERSSSSSAALDHYSASSDDEVTALIGTSAHGSPLPLEFRTSPPEGAHRPTRSLSPPPKLFAADAEHLVGAGAGGGATASGGGVTASGGGALAALSVANGNVAGSPRKRHRHTHRPHNIQRPCLDFEKMQQVSPLLPIISNPSSRILLFEIFPYFGIFLPRFWP